MLRWLTALLAALFTFGAQAATYVYTGGLYSNIANASACAAPQLCGQFTASQRVTGYITTAAPLAANLVDVDVAVTGYWFSNGVSTIASGDSASRMETFKVTTDGSGAITEATVSVQRWTYSAAQPPSPDVGPHAAGDRFDSITVVGANASAASINGFCSVSNITTPADTCANAIGTDTANSVAVGLDGTWGAPPTVSINSVSMAEGNAGTTAMNFTVTLSAAPIVPVSVTVGHTPITATAGAGADYVLALTSLTWAAGDAAAKTVPVSIFGDTTVEPDETFEITLSAPVGATLGTAVGIGTILNDDVAAPVPTMSINSVSMAEGNAGTTTMNFTVTLSAAPIAPVSVTVGHTPITATAGAGADYVLALTSLTWAAGDAVTKTVPVSIVGDTTVEPDETFQITLSAPVGATLGTAVGIGTILNDDVAPVASATAIPTLSEWTLALLALTCAALGLRRLRRA